MKLNVRDLEAQFRQSGFSIRRSKAGAAAAWKALAGEPEPAVEDDEAARVKQFFALIARDGE